ncbi:peptidoglycan-binding protein [Streptomyces sp. NPDC048332]|uniref:peptidoglycan-binding protein n=1 Tax=Streptomyces sp. NPDC048332 TaxID=3154619 RepID=UPI00343BBAAA
MDDMKEPGRRRRGPLLITAGVLLVAAVSTVGALGLGGGGSDDDKAEGRGGRLVEVSRETLTDRTEIDGQLGHGPQTPFPVKARGTITWLPASGTTAHRGEQVLRVDDRPVVLLYGSLPMYRDLGLRQTTDSAAGGGSGSSTGTGEETGTGEGTGKGADSGENSGSGASSSARSGTDAGGGGGSSGGPDAGQPASDARQRPVPLHGMDVKQFESNLSALGYSGFTVDDSYTELTAAAVRRWQKDLGLPRTGTVDAGSVVYAPGAVRIAGTSARVGAEATGTPVTYTTTSRMVTVDAQATETRWAQRGTTVSVELPDGRSVPGTVASVGKDAAAPESGTASGTDGGAAGGSDGEGDPAATVAVVIVFGDQASLGRLQSGPVTVRYTVKQRKNVLAVPVAALVALAEGGYGLEISEEGSEEDGSGAGTGDGASRGFVPVRTGLFAGGKVEVSGPRVREGMKVRVPE